MADRSEGRRAVFISSSRCRLGVLPAQQVLLGALKVGLCWSYATETFWRDDHDDEDPVIEETPRNRRLNLEPDAL